MAVCEGAPTSTLRLLQEATESLLQTTRHLTEPDMRRPSLLPGWSRAHVLSHLAGNAEGGTRLLEGVVSGMPSWEYRDLDSRAIDIETGSHDPVDVLVARVEATAQRFDDACVKVLPEQWATLVTWTTGHQNAAREVVTSRLFEVQIHHVDLATGRTLDDWPDELVATVFDVVVEAFNVRADFPPMTLRLSDHPDRPTVGNGSSPLGVAGRRLRCVRRRRGVGRPFPHQGHGPGGPLPDGALLRFGTREPGNPGTFPVRDDHRRPPPISPVVRPVPVADRSPGWLPTPVGPVGLRGQRPGPW